jgi:hypothetical protein
MARAEANRGSTSDVISWAVEDTGFRPSYVVLDVARGWSLGTPTNQLFVSGSGGWNPTLVALHTPATGQPAIRMVVVLYPDYTGIPAPAPLIPAIPPFIDAYYGHPERVQSYYQLLWTIGFVTHTCVSIRADAVQLDFPSPPVFVQPYADLTLAGPGPFDDPFTHACTP